jgi:signal transduction histidine kinase/DNA-binding response OmpR family regulator
MPETQVAAPTIAVRVERILAAGLLVRLPGGKAGLIRSRELTWHKHEQQNWRQRFQLGATLNVVIIDTAREPVELSLRLAEADPWRDLEQRYPPGTVIDGVVTGHGQRVTYIEVEPGVTGRLTAAELPPWLSGTAEEHLWVGDPVRVIVQAVRPQERALLLSMKTLLEQRWSATSSPPLASPAPDPCPPIQQAVTAETSNPIPKRSHSILLVEDDPAQNQAITQWLRSAGQQVTGLETAAEALAFVRDYQPEILICDVGLSSQDGILTVQQARELVPTLQCILMTDWATADNRRLEISTLEAQGVALLLKPLLPEELTHVLDWLDEEGAVIPDQGTSAQAQPSKLAQQMPAATHQIVPGLSLAATRQSLHGVLRTLRRTTRAGKVILFALDPQVRQVQIIAQLGKGEVHNEALTQLIYSPVRNVAEEGMVVHVDDVETMANYVRYLRPLLSFRSCVGVPVPCQLEQRYALFLFHPQTGFTGATIQEAAQASAVAVGAILERQKFIQQASDIQRTVLMGQLSRSLIHETNHQLNPILFTLSDLRYQLGELSLDKQSGDTHHREQIAELQQSLADLSAGVEKLVKTTRMFGRVTVQDQEEHIRIDLAVEQCLELVRDAANAAHVQLHLHPPAHLLVTQAKYSQVQQIVLNLLLNAIQQIELLRPKGGGHIHIRQYLRQKREGEHVISVEVEDDGPGIHQKLWQSIFDLGFSLRKGQGSGLGLYVARSLIENTGGVLKVAESHLLWGTTMLAEFPVRLAP